MIKPKDNFLIRGFFDRYIRLIMSRHFKLIAFNRPSFDQQKSILLIANHFSWWDGFLLYHVNKKLFKKKFHIMVLEQSMLKIGFLKYLGAFSVAKNSRQVMESLNYAAGLLNHPGNMVVIFPQGRLYSNFADDLVFESGAARIAAIAAGTFQYVFAASFVENFQYKKPGAHIYLSVLSVDAVPAGGLPGAYRQYYNWSKQQQTNISV